MKLKQESGIEERERECVCIRKIRIQVYICKTDRERVSVTLCALARESERDSVRL